MPRDHQHNPDPNVNAARIVGGSAGPTETRSNGRARCTSVAVQSIAVTRSAEGSRFECHYCPLAGPVLSLAVRWEANSEHCRTSRQWHPARSPRRDPYHRIAVRQLFELGESSRATRRGGEASGRCPSRLARSGPGLPTRAREWELARWPSRSCRSLLAWPR